MGFGADRVTFVNRVELRLSPLRSYAQVAEDFWRRSSLSDIDYTAPRFPRGVVDGSSRAGCEVETSRAGLARADARDASRWGAPAPLDALRSSRSSCPRDNNSLPARVSAQPTRREDSSCRHPLLLQDLFATFAREVTTRLDPLPIWKTSVAAW